MELFDSLGYVITICGTISFAISGAFAAMQKRLDAFGVLIVAFVTAVGGGTLRDLIVGDTPVFWLKGANYSLLIILTALFSMFFWKKLKSLKITLFLFDSLGLGFFTIVGLQKGLSFDLSPGICIALGTITGCFGGITRDILLNNIPLIFRKEIYATACIVGGLCFFLLSYLGMNIALVEIISVIVVFVIRIISVKYNFTLPRFY
ncbi:putative membrane protein [Pedobacter glucosidilyticus]|uniref:Trimeric intracellular cation channel family protein n=1 Tax=Pedobacter aquae TaxID=2605747 RepID=A0A5C0VJH5_9SPHI|nr:MULTISPECIES: trimeric intracellular cation channel family protein [Pedobacter]KHJ37868.1 putative membrane protein [Pedobacter glucosidilyticus]QEK51923.1 trimeric intracellular cation channel family protein [Pedobacter aquae]